MPHTFTFTRRRTHNDDPDRDDDHVFLVDGIDFGRCYRKRLPGKVEYVWHWTVYGRPISGDKPTFEEAQEAFKRAIMDPATHAPGFSPRLPRPI